MRTYGCSYFWCPCIPTAASEGSKNSNRKHRWSKVLCKVNCMFSNTDINHIKQGQQCWHSSIAENLYPISLTSCKRQSKGIYMYHKINAWIRAQPGINQTWMTSSTITLVLKFYNQSSERIWLPNWSYNLEKSWPSPEASFFHEVCPFPGHETRRPGKISFFWEDAIPGLGKKNL